MARPSHLVGVVLLVACASRQGGPDGSVRVTANGAAPADSSARPTLIYRGTSYTDDALAALGLGRLEFAIRSAGRPTQVIPQAYVIIRAGDQASPRRLLSDQRGIAAYDSIAVGRYQVVVRAMGYASATFEAAVSPGCRTDVEVYIGVMAMGIAPPPPEPSRAVITMCRPER